MLKLLKDILYPLLSKIYRIVLRKVLQRKKISLPTSATVKLSYANAVPSLSKAVFGGRVKFSLLNEVFPEQKNEFNILYLISSALSIYAKEWFKVCKRVGVKVIWNQNGVGYSAWAGKRYDDVNRSMRELIHQSDWVIYQSEFCKMSADKYLGKFRGPWSIIHNCVDASVFTPHMSSLPLSCIKLLIMGSHEQPYRVIKAVETLSVLRKRKINAKLTIAGRLAWPGAKKDVKRVINSMKLTNHITILGPYLQKDAPFLYQNAHILLHLKYGDPCPTVVVEAMACGVPVIGSRSGGVPELLGKEGGIVLDVPQSWDELYVPGSEKIADAVISIMNDWRWWCEQTRRRVVENFNKEIWISKHRDIFCKLIGEN